MAAIVMAHDRALVWRRQTIKRHDPASDPCGGHAHQQLAAAAPFPVVVQAIARIYRFGQTRASFVYRLMLAGTVDEVVYGCNVDKEELFSKVRCMDACVTVWLRGGCACLRSVQTGRKHANNACCMHSGP